MDQSRVGRRKTARKGRDLRLEFSEPALASCRSGGGQVDSAAVDTVCDLDPLSETCFPVGEIEKTRVSQPYSKTTTAAVRQRVGGTSEGEAESGKGKVSAE